jgi:hypothetical protein
MERREGKKKEKEKEKEKKAIRVEGYKRGKRGREKKKKEKGISKEAKCPMHNRYSTMWLSISPPKYLLCALHTASLCMIFVSRQAWSALPWLPLMRRPVR